MHNFLLFTVLLGAPVALTSTSQSHPLHPLSWDVYLQPPVPIYDPPNNFSFSPTAFTLIHGANSAILVDAPITTNSSSILADWIERTIPGKKLTHVYVTHGHGDHFFGISVLQQRFPGLKAVATEHTLEHMKQQVEPDFFASFWLNYFPGDQIPPQDYLDSVEILAPNDKFYLEGHVLQAVEVGQTDTYNTTVLHVPDLDLVVTGDAVYGECYQFFLETNTNALREQWLQAIDEIQGLGATHVVPSHKQEWDGFGIDHFAKTKGYIYAWEQQLIGATDVDELEDRMKKAYPERVGDFILGLSAGGAFGGSLPG